MPSHKADRVTGGLRAGEETHSQPTPNDQPTLASPS